MFHVMLNIRPRLLTCLTALLSVSVVLVGLFIIQTSQNESVQSTFPSCRMRFRCRNEGSLHVVHGSAATALVNVDSVGQLGLLLCYCYDRVILMETALENNNHDIVLNGSSAPYSTEAVEKDIIQ